MVLFSENICMLNLMTRCSQYSVELHTIAVTRLAKVIIMTLLHVTRYVKKIKASVFSKAL
jgi:hypothetical protein